MIVKRGGTFVVMAESGRPMGTYGTRAEAEHRLQQIEMHKAMDEKKSAAMGKKMNRRLRGQR